MKASMAYLVAFSVELFLLTSVSVDLSFSVSSTLSGKKILALAHNNTGTVVRKYIIILYSEKNVPVSVVWDFCAIFPRKYS